MPAPTWRERKYSGGGNRDRNSPTPRNHAEDRHCYCDLLGAGLLDGQAHEIAHITAPDGTDVPITDRERARVAKNRAYTCSRLRGEISLIMSAEGLGLVEKSPGVWVFRFKAAPRDVAKTHIEGRRAAGEELAYDRTATPKLRERRKSRKQTERELTAERAPLVAAMDDVIRDHYQPVPGWTPDQRDVPPVTTPAPPTHCGLCGKTLRHGDGAPYGSTGEIVCTACQVKHQLFDRVIAAENSRKRAMDAMLAYGKRQTGP